MDLSKIKPSKEEQEKLKSLIDEIIKKIKVKGAKAVLGGSGAKNTWLKNTKDMDIYVKFNYNKFKNKSSEISKILESSLRKKFKITKLKGSRDYFQIKQGNHTFEIVPILDIRNSKQAKNITDVSQLHVNYVKKFSKLADEIRLAKAFCQAQNCYGAESYIKGFSGYVLELLVIYYKSFNNLIKNAANWKAIQLIGNKKFIENLNFSKKQSPLILIDPVQQDRNAAAALNIEKYEMFKKACKAYLKNPSDKFFIPKKFTVPKDAIILEVIPKTGKKDIIGAKLLKTLQYINTQLTLEGYKVKKYDWNWDKKAIFYFLIENKNLSKHKIQIGPPLKQVEHVNAFKKKHKKTFVKDNRVCAEVSRKYTKIEDFLKSLFKNKEIKARTKKLIFQNQKL